MHELTLYIEKNGALDISSVEEKLSRDSLDPLDLLDMIKIL
jgi:hypothetical protein